MQYPRLGGASSAVYYAPEGKLLVGACVGVLLGIFDFLNKNYFGRVLRLCVVMGKKDIQAISARGHAA